ncbi:hypothetical protein M8J75_012397 [Diaphorina citri]|nr:hypothetical protein M8J75_012397 [Diaphorina citri]
MASARLVLFMPKRLGDDDILLRKRPHKKKKARLDTKNKPSAKKINAKSKARGSKSKEVQLSDTSWDEEDDLPLTLSPGESALLRGNKTGSKLKIRTQEEINFAYSTCRLCARSRGSHLLIDIFDPSIDLSSLIATLLPISVSRSDRKPLKICQTCAIRLEKFDSFCRSVRRSDAYFNALLGQEKDQVGDVEVTEPKNPSEKVSFKSGVVVPIKLVIRAVTSSQNQINNQTESQANSQTDNQIDCQTDSQADNQIVNQTVKEEWTDKTSLPLREEENHETPSSDDLPDSVVRPSVADPPIKTEPSIEEPPEKPEPSSEVLGDLLKIPSSQTAEKEAVRGRFLQEECDIKEEPQDEIEDRVADDIPGEGDMFETHVKMSDSCGRCQQEIQDDYSYCKTCKSKYHFQCNTVSESSWRSMGPERKAQWKCASCRDKEKERKMINTPEQQVRSSDSETTLKSLENFMSSQFANMNKKMDEKFSDFEASLNFYGDKFDEMSKTLKSLEQKVVLLENQLKQSETENKELKKRVRNMEVQLNMMDQRQNNNKLEITGIKDKEVNEKELMMKIMEKVQPAPESNVQYRVEKIVKPGKDNRPSTTTLVVHFNNQEEVPVVMVRQAMGTCHTAVHQATPWQEVPGSIPSQAMNPTMLTTTRSVHNTKSQVIYFPCPLCPDKLRTESELGAHVATHADTILAPYECFSCDFSDNDFMAMAKHIVESHCEVTSDNRYECPICEDQETMASSFHELCTHLYESHIPEEKVNLVSCPVCNVRLGNDTAHIRSHLLTHTTRQTFIRPKYYRCPACNAGFKSQINLVKHACPNIVNNRCEECDINFPSKMRHTFHLQHHLEDPMQLKCDICFTDPLFYSMCEECDINFPSKMRHTFHLQHHLEDPMQLKCDICFTDFDDENSLYDHVRFIHVQDNQLKCTICNKENFKNQLSLSIHMRYHENVREYECEICKKKFINKSTLKEHSVSHMSVKPFKCEICGHYLSRASRLRAHLKAHSVVASNNKVQNCKKCFKCCQVFPSNEENLRKHFEKVHFDLEFDEAHFYDVVLKCVYRCEFCDSCFNVPHELNRHRFANHPEPDSPTAFSCMVCGVAFPAYSRLTTHKLTHGINTESLIITDEDEKNDRFRIVQYFLCELCDKTSIHYTYLCLHKKLKHSNLTYGGESPVCEPCNLTFKNEWQYLVHNRAVHELPPEPNSGAGSVLQNNPYPPLRKAKQHVKSVTCSVCEKAFSSKENCKAHYTRQHGNKEPKEPKSGEGLPALEQLLKMKPYTCEICSKTYTVEGSLLTHYDMHSGEFYQCDVCFKEFRSSVTLRNHTRRHDNFSCDECSVECQDLNALRMHTLREHGYKILACEKCDVKFTHKALLAEHINTKHNTDVTLKCQLCNVAEVQQHLEEHKVVIIRCETCTRNYESLESLTTHLSFKHSNQFLMKCTNCNVLVPRDEILPHLAIQHCQGTTPSIYECNQCKEKTNDMTTMLNHYSVKHYMDINMSCVPCDVLFHNKATLYKHLYLEHKATSLSIQCNMCSLVLDSKESLVTHISQTHTLMFTCRRCPSTFLNSATLSKHVKMEHNSKSYQCNECPESFERLNKLKRHKFQAHNDSVHQIQCPYCITDFSEDKNLIQHIVSVHLGKEGTAPART